MSGLMTVNEQPQAHLTLPLSTNTTCPCPCNTKPVGSSSQRLLGCCASCIVALLVSPEGSQLKERRGCHL
ncbi:hypothetical protein AGIG_G6418 [Arapaima gigas]